MKRDWDGADADVRSADLRTDAGIRPYYERIVALGGNACGNV